MSSEKENSKLDDMKEEDKDPKDDSAGESKDDTDDKSAEESEEKEKEPPKRKQTKVKENKKTVKSEEEEEDEEDDEEEDEEDDDDKDDKVPLLDQPLELSGTRERKKVQRFTEEFKTEPKDIVVIEIPEGKGTALGAIPQIEASITKFRPDALKPLHKVIFGRVGKSTTLKRNIRKFNGFDFEKDSDQFEKKKVVVQKLEMRLLRMICSVLDIERSGNRETMAERIMHFLMEPKDSGKLPITPRPKRSGAKVNNRSYSESDDEKRPSRSKRGKGKRSTLKEPTSSDDDPDKEDAEEDNEKEKESEAEEEEDDPGSANEDDDDDDEPKSKKKKSRSKGSKASAKKSSTKKSNSKKSTNKKAEKKPATKKRKSPSKSEDDSSSEDEPLAKKTKAPPTDDEIKTYVKEILEGANLEEITMKTVCKQVYAHYPDFDLAHKKDFIKVTVKSLIST